MSVGITAREGRPNGPRATRPYQQTPLSDRAIKALAASHPPGADTNKPIRRADGGGPYVERRPNGSRLWRFAYRFDRKQGTFAIGTYPAVSLANARRRREEAKALLASGTDPMAHAKAEKARRSTGREHTFESVARELIAKKEREGRASTTLDEQRWLLDLAVPALGSRPIREIGAPDMLEQCLRPIESRGTHETAKRLRSFIGEVFRYAIATGL